MKQDKMWERLAAHQPYADKRGYGPEWARMCAERTRAAAWAADAAAWAAASEVAAALAGAAEAVRWIKRSEEEK
jgi:hypothetical protein